MTALSWSYRQTPLEPFWGPTNSMANFCEEDHIITAYIAEFINTLTNITYLFYAYHGIRANSNRTDAVLRNLPYLGIAGVGIGSAVFHATLKNYTQWCDELSMLIATATVLHRVFTFDKSIQLTVLTGIAFATLMATFIAWHCWMDETFWHSILFGVMIAFVGVKTRSIIKARVSNEATRAEVTKLCTYGGIIFVTGFGLWNIDNWYCSILTEIKRSIGMPWSFIFELHGWWHIFTGVGAYIFIALVEYLTSEDAGQPLAERFAWPVNALVNCSAGAHSHGDGNSNGQAKVNGNGNINGNINGHINGHINGKEMNGNSKALNGNGVAKKAL